MLFLHKLVQNSLIMLKDAEMGESLEKKELNSSICVR